MHRSPDASYISITYLVPRTQAVHKRETGRKKGQDKYKNLPEVSKGQI